MTDKERLVEVIQNKTCRNGTCIPNCAECNNVPLTDEDVDRLADGWIKPPCKAGDIVYFVARNSGEPIGAIDEVEIVMIGKTESGWCAKGKLGKYTFDILNFEIDNHGFFASREEAEKALRGGEADA